jgi:hypothetical protein
MTPIEEDIINNISKDLQFCLFLTEKIIKKLSEGEKINKK